MGKPNLCFFPCKEQLFYFLKYKVYLIKSFQLWIMDYKLKKPECHPINSRIHVISLKYSIISHLNSCYAFCIMDTILYSIWLLIGWHKFQFWLGFQFCLGLYMGIHAWKYKGAKGYKSFGYRIHFYFCGCKFLWIS